jgi:hypothetical protein
MEREVMILIGKIHFEGHWKGWALKIKIILGPEMATSQASAIWGPKKSRYIDQYLFTQGRGG